MSFLMLMIKEYQRIYIPTAALFEPLKFWHKNTLSSLEKVYRDVYTSPKFGAYAKHSESHLN